MPPATGRRPGAGDGDAVRIDRQGRGPLYRPDLKLCWWRPLDAVAKCSNQSMVRRRTPLRSRPIAPRRYLACNNRQISATYLVITRASGGYAEIR